MARYTPDDKARAIGALYASAQWSSEGEPTPNLSQAAEATGYPLTTIKRWWHARDTAIDSQKWQEATRKRQIAEQMGADDFERYLRAQTQELAQRAMDPARVARAGTFELWKSAKLARDLADAYNADIGPSEDDGRPQSRLGRLRQRINNSSAKG